MKTMIIFISRWILSNSAAIRHFYKDNGFQKMALGLLYLFVIIYCVLSSLKNQKLKIIKPSFYLKSMSSISIN